MNYTEELKEKDQRFVLTHDESKLGTRGRNYKNGTTPCRELRALNGNNDSGS